MESALVSRIEVQKAQPVLLVRPLVIQILLPLRRAQTPGTVEITSPVDRMPPSAFTSWSRVMK